VKYIRDLRHVIAAAVAGLAVAVLAGGGTAASATQAAAPSNTSPPTISGEAREGQRLTGSRGEWTGTEPMTFAFRWLRCDRTGDDCWPISGATALS